MQHADTLTTTGASLPAGARIGLARWVRAGLLTLIGLVAAWSWLVVVSKWGPANRIDIMTFKAGLTSTVQRTLLRQGEGAGHHSHTAAMISGLYATPTYFTMTEQTQDADRYRPDRHAVFYLFEDIHLGQLSRTAPAVSLRLDDGRQVKPVDTEVLRDSPHHRATLVRFPKADADGAPLFDENRALLTLASHDPAAHVEQTMQWSLPIVYPTGLEGTGLPLPTLIALLAGLLAVLSPCLLQLTVYYTFALAGMNARGAPASGLAAGSVDVAAARRRVIATALYFIAGFTVVFTASGALAGLAGERLQTSGLMEAWNRPLMIASGIGILVLGVWVGASSGAPGLCRLPRLAALGGGSRWFDRLKTMFLGAAFAIGCSTCFGGALFISLMIYVGSIGSASVGALALFLFSVGIAVPYLLAAVFLSRALPLLTSVHRVSAGIGAVCSVVLIFFGLILLTDTFHIPSDLLYRLYLGI
jgi:cytochrome c-type biogenesis protein